MRRAKLLERIRELSGKDAPGRADRILQVVIDALRDEMTGAEAKTVSACLPAEYQGDWNRSSGYPSDIIEKEEMMFDAGVKR
ncbi:MAG TPA: DUF2267 domain-containing protein [Deferrisomatales bacterium]|nr:DUF2267 domain-containing protein [Deferrisomatales bacterium]